MNRQFATKVQKSGNSDLLSIFDILQRKSINSTAPGATKTSSGLLADEHSLQGIAVQLYSDPSPPPEFDEAKLPEAAPAGGPVPDNGAAVASIEAGAGATADSETTSATRESEEEAVQTSVQNGAAGAEQLRAAFPILASGTSCKWHPAEHT